MPCGLDSKGAARAHIARLFQPWQGPPSGFRVYLLEQPAHDYDARLLCSAGTVPLLVEDLVEDLEEKPANKRPAVAETLHVPGKHIRIRRHCRCTRLSAAVLSLSQQRSACTALLRWAVPRELIADVQGMRLWEWHKDDPVSSDRTQPCAAQRKACFRVAINCHAQR